MKAMTRLRPSGALRMAMGLALVLLLGIAIQARPASADGVVNSLFLGGVAIEGTDPVAYFNDGRPVEGSSD